MTAPLFKPVNPFDGYDPSWIETLLTTVTVSSQPPPLSDDEILVTVDITVDGAGIWDYYTSDRHEVESACDVDENGIETCVVDPTIIFPIIELGRTYHGYGSTEYWGPDDDQAKEHQDLEHDFHKSVFNGRLFTAPLGDNPQAILDLGTGTGAWANKVADMYPSSRVVGLDVSPMWYKESPNEAANAEFLIADINSEDFEEDDEIYDYIHGRGLHGCIKDLPELIGKCYKALKPNGLVEFAGSDIRFSSDSIQNELLHEWEDFLINAGEETGMSFDVSSKLPGFLEAAGFVEVKVEERTVDVGGDSELGRPNLERLCRGLFDLSARRFSNVLGWSIEKIEVYLAYVRNELRGNGKDVTQKSKFYAVSARKPC